MLGRAVVVVTCASFVAGAAIAQTTETSRENAGAPARPVATVAETALKSPQPLASEPDPLTPPEVAGPPPAAPGAPVAAAPTPAAAIADPFVLEVRQRLALGRGRESGSDAADRAGLIAYYASDAAKPVWTTASGFNARAGRASAEIRNANDWGLKASAFDLPVALPADASPQARADAEIKLGLAALKYARHARGGRVDPQSVSKLLDRKPRIYDPKTLIDALAATEATDAYLRALHPKHAQFQNLRKALVAARSSAEAPPAAETLAEPDPVRGSRKKVVARARSDSKSDTIQRLVVNMERWRWMPDDLGQFHVMNNVPEQITTTVSNGKVVFTERIVVGKPDTPTPNFSADMQFVIFQPEWGVPGGIKNNEIAPLLRRASASNSGWFGDSGRTPSSVLARHGLRVSVNGQLVNPDNVNWSSVDVNRFNFIQPAGPTNVLGVVKFRFPNKHDVYMHDTPQKNLFSAGLRAFSHGCMRVQNPVRFAEVLLEHDKGWASDRVRSMVPRGGEVKLTRSIPVHNVYFTAMADDEGKVRTAGDLYGIDSRMASALEGRSVAIASKGETGAAGGDVAQRAKGERQVRQKVQTARSSPSSNPFAGLFGN